MKFFRVLALVEMASLLTLMFIAMPIKYLLGNPEVVRVVGAIHGALFLMFVYTSISVGLERKWSWKRIGMSWIIASVPFGPILFEKRLLAR